MDAAALRDFESVAEAALGHAVSADDRASAQAKINSLTEGIEHIATIQQVLDASTNDLAIVAASKVLLSLVTEHWNSFTGMQRVEVRAYAGDAGKGRAERG